MSKARTGSEMESALEELKGEYNASGDMEERATILAEIRVLEWCLGRSQLGLLQYRSKMEETVVRSFRVGGSKPPAPLGEPSPRKPSISEELDDIERRALRGPLRILIGAVALISSPRRRSAQLIYNDRRGQTE